MKKSKPSKKTFLLEENGNTVFAKLQVENDYGIEMTISEMPNARVRAKRPTKKLVETIAWSEMRMDPRFKSPSEALSKYSEGMNQQIMLHLQDIRKSLKHIQTLSCFIKLAEEVQCELPKNP